VLNAFPFSRAGHVSASLERCGELVDRGYSILVFPEGSRAPEGALLPFKNGIGLLARGLGIPLVPVAVSGGHKVLPKGAVWPSRAAVRVAFGRPVPIAKGASPQEIAMVLHRHVADLLREAQAHEH
jgi:long-chain acyl-CoA synthetase